MGKIKFIILIILVGLVLASPCYAQNPAINNGLTWLTTNQNTDGSWGTQPDLSLILSTEAINSLKNLDAVTDYNEGITWLTVQDAISTDELARKIYSLVNAGIDSSALINTLIGYKNSDGGWGYGIGQWSDTTDTVFALLALKSASYSDTTILTNAISYLLSNQNIDGGFGFYSGDDSNVYMTALVSSTLQQFQQTTSIATAVNKATTFLLAHQNTDGGFGSSPSTVYETAYAYMALVGVSTDATVLGNAINYLTSTQSTNGSWNDDPYSTALALRALYFSQNKPTPPPQSPTQIDPISTTPSTTATIVTGIVVDAPTGNPVPGADMVIAGTNFSAKTDSTGTYVITGIDLLEFSIKASATGYNTLSYNVTTAFYGTYTIDFALSQSQASDLMIVSLTTDNLGYSANTDVEITTTIENTGSTAVNTIIIAHINDNMGDTVAMARPLSREITIQPLSSASVDIIWNTGQLSPGDYQVVLKVTAPSIEYYNLPGAVLAEKATPITIKPFTGIADSAIKLTPTFTYVNAAETLTTNLSFANKSNIPAELTIAYTIKSPSGVILNSGSVPVSLSLDTVTANIALTAFTYNFNETGEYPVDVIVYNNGNILAAASDKFTVLSNIRIEPSRSVSPQTVIPEGTGKVRITIELKGVEVK